MRHTPKGRALCYGGVRRSYGAVGAGALPAGSLFVAAGVLPVLAESPVEGDVAVLAPFSLAVVSVFFVSVLFVSVFESAAGLFAGVAFL